MSGRRWIRISDSRLDRKKRMKTLQITSMQWGVSLALELRKKDDKVRKKDVKEKPRQEPPKHPQTSQAT